MSQAITTRSKVGDVVGGKYALLRLVGEGGMAAVYEAENSWTGRRVAIKLLLPEFSANPEALERFRQEARVMTRLAHPNVADVLDMGQEGDSGSLYIVSEFLRGDDLRAFLMREKKLHPAEAIALLLPVMGALVSAHAHGVVHRDLKPENVFLERDRARGVTPKLIDFGIAKVLGGGDASPRIRTRVGVIVGTPEYLSPELMRGGEPADGRADVWAMGVILYEALAGRLPWYAQGEDRHPFELAVRIVTDAAPRIEQFVPDIPPALAKIVHDALERDLDKRFATMRAFVAAILECPVEVRHSAAARTDSEVSIDAPDAQRPQPGASAPTVPASNVAGDEDIALLDADLDADLDPDLDIPVEFALESDPPEAMVATPLTPDAHVAAITAASADLGEMARACIVAPGSRTLLEFPMPAPLVAALDMAAVEARAQSAAAPAPAALGDEHSASHPPPVPSGELSRQRLRESEEALLAGALERAIALAREGFANAGEDHQLAGACRLVQAAARRWRGSLAACERSAIKALTLLETGTPRWFRALGELAYAYGSVGKNEQLAALVERLRSAQAHAPMSDEFAIAACRLAIQLYWAGWPEDARLVASWAPAESDAERLPAVRAWRCKLAAVRASHDGDVSSALADFAAAAELFAQAGDLPNTCMERSNVAEGLIQMGAYKEARVKAEETLEVAQRLGLFVEAWLRCNLGVALSRLGELDAARAMATSAVALCERQGNRRTEGWSRVYLSRILLRIGALDEAETEARAAIEVGAAMPPIRANASAALATVLGRRGRWADAVDAAEAAMKLLDAMGGTGDGEAYVRLTYGSVLASAGRRTESDEAMNVAQQRLVARAANISDPRWRMSFLENVPEHAATLEADSNDVPLSGDATGT